MNDILKTIGNSLVGDLWDWETPPKWFQPIWIVRQGHTRYKVNKVIKWLKEKGYVKYVSLGGGVDDDFEPTPPFNGYEFTESGLKWLESEENQCT